MGESMKRMERAQEFGRHNENIRQSTARIIEGGSWRKQRVISLIPTASMISARVYLNHCSLIFPPNQPAHRMAAIGMEVGEAYSNAITEILANPELSKWEFLLTLESDNLAPSDGIIKLIKRMEAHPEMSWISGLYSTKGEGGVFQCWGDPKTDPMMNFRPQPPDPNGGLIETYGTGMGFCLWRLKMFKDERLRRPWFKTVADHTGVGTQDLFFAADARKFGYRCGVDCSVLIGHLDLEGKFGPPDTVW